MKNKKRITFLSLAEVIEIHIDQINNYGGLDGIRDMNLLCSAIAMPCASYNSKFLHSDIFEMAAAYAFHLCQNHPFIDGNKRTALASALVFLEMNGITIIDSQSKLYDIMILLASGRCTKAELATIFKDLYNQ